MTLRDLMGRGRPRSRSRLSPTPATASPRGRCFFAFRGSPVTATSSPRRGRTGRRGARDASARSTWACRRWSSTTCAPRWAPRPPASTATPPRSSTWSASPARTARRRPPSSSATCSRPPGRQTGLLGTVKRVVGGVEEEVERTTPEAIDLQATFRRMLDAGDTAVAMEVSSHALELGRVAGIRFAVKLFTNLTQDHLDFHGTMEAYFAAKRRLFDEPGVAVVNVDDEHGRRIASEVDAVTFGIESATPTTARARSSSTSRARASCSTRPDGPLELDSPLPGLFNVLNVAGAIAAVRSLGVGRDLARGLPARARSLRARGRGPGLRRARGLRAHARLARERAAHRARAHQRAPARGVRRRRRPRPQQAAAHGPRRARAGRPRARDLRQPAQRGAGGDHRPGHGGRRPGGRARRRPPPRDRAAR